MLLPEEGDFSQLGVKKQGLHFVTAGSKGGCHFHVWSLKGGTSVTSLPLFLGCVFSMWLESRACSRVPRAGVDEQDGAGAAWSREGGGVHMTIQH